MRRRRRPGADGGAMRLAGTAGRSGLHITYAWAQARVRMPVMGGLSLRSEDSFLSIASRGSILSIGSVGSVLSIGSVGSALSIASVGSTLSAFSAGSVLSFGSALSARSRWSLLSSEGDHDVLKAPPRPAFVAGSGVALAVLLAAFSHRR